MTKLLKCIILSISFCLIGCTKDVNFDQLDDIEIETNLLLTFAHFNLNSSEFSNGGDIEITDLVQLPIDDGGGESLTKVIFEIIADNSFDSAFNIEIEFLDEDKNSFYKLTPEIIVPANSQNLTTIIEIPENEIFNIFQMEYIQFFVIKEPESSVNDTSQLSIKSSMELFFKFDSE